MTLERKQRSIRCKECGEILYYDMVKISEKVWRSDRKHITEHYDRCFFKEASGPVVQKLPDPKPTWHDDF